MNAVSTADPSPLAADLKVQDQDRYLATLFAPADRREALFALYAFDHEIAKVRRLVREPMAGLIRLQWWRDTLDGIENGDVPVHPVVRGLDHAITRHGLDRGFLDAAILAREREFDGLPPEDLMAFDEHLTATNGGIVRAAVRLLGCNDRDVLAIADRLGQCLGLLEKLRMLGAERGDLPLWLPKALLAEHGLAEQGLTEAGRGKIEAIQEMLASRARDHLALARKDRARVPRHLLPAFFPGTLADVHLRDIHRPQERPAIAAAPFRLLWHWLCGSF